MDQELSVEENSEQTIRRQLSTYEIGPKIRKLRMKKKIALVDLGSHTGLSASMLSQLENGKMVPTLGTLARIAMVFDVSLDHFFGSTTRKLITIDRAGSRMRFPDRGDKPNPSYFFECLAFASQSKTMQAYIAEFPHQPDAQSDPHIHDGSELIYIIQGELLLQMESDEYHLKTGDNAFFDSSTPHSYRGMDPDGTKAIVVTNPPRAI